MLAVMLFLVIFLSVVQSQQSLMSQSPQEMEGWIFVQNPSGELIKQEFLFLEDQTISVARLIDSGKRVQANKTAQKLGEFRITFATGRKNTFEMNTLGVKRLDGFGWQTTLPSNELIEIIQKFFSSSENPGKAP